MHVRPVGEVNGVPAHLIECVMWCSAPRHYASRTASKSSDGRARTSYSATRRIQVIAPIGWWVRGARRTG